MSEEDGGRDGLDLTFDVLTEAFVARRAAERLSKETLEGDRRALQLLLASARARLNLGEGARVSVLSITSEDLLGVLATLRERGRAAGTLASYVAVYRAFFRDLAMRGVLLLDPSERLPPISAEDGPRYVPGFLEMKRLLETPETRTDLGTRDRAILELLYGSGLRRAELVNLSIQDLDLPGRTAFVREGKGKKDRVVPLTEEAARWVAAYLARRPSHPSPRVFLDQRGERPLTTSRLSNEMRKVFANAGSDPRLTLHSIRHACALHLLEGGADLISIKQLLGHSSIETTAGYLKLTTAHLKREVERAHPREREVARKAKERSRESGPPRNPDDES